MKKNINKKSIQENVEFDANAKSEFNISTITGILNTLIAVFNMPEQPAQQLPPMLVLAGAKLRPGLSADQKTADEIAARKAAGIPTGDIFADGPNVDELAIKIKNDIEVEHLKTKPVVQITIPAGQRVTTTGIVTYPGFTMVSQGVTTNDITVQGIII